MITTVEIQSNNKLVLMMIRLLHRRILKKKLINTYCRTAYERNFTPARTELPCLPPYVLRSTCRSRRQGMPRPRQMWPIMRPRPTLAAVRRHECGVVHVLSRNTSLAGPGRVREMHSISIAPQRIPRPSFGCRVSACTGPVVRPCTFCFAKCDSFK